MLQEGNVLGSCFTEAVGWYGDQWEGPDYVPVEDDEQADAEEFESCYKAATQYIQDQFVSRNQVPNRVVFCHVVTATNTDNIEKVFWDVQNIVIRSNLKRGGLMV